MSIVDVLLNAANVIDDYIKDEFIKQGHELTGAWQNSLHHKEGNENDVEGFAKAYGLIVNEGIISSRIPFGNENEGRTKGVESEYINALAKYWKLRQPGIDDKKALKLAFATAIVQKREGMSTIASEQYSANGKRQQFLSALKTLFEDYLDQWIFDGFDNFINQESKEPKRLVM